MKIGTIDGTFTQQKPLAQSGRSTRSTLYIFNTLRVSTKEPIREQKTELECINDFEGLNCLHFDHMLWYAVTLNPILKT